MATIIDLDYRVCMLLDLKHISLKERKWSFIIADSVCSYVDLVSHSELSTLSL